MSMDFDIEPLLKMLLGGPVKHDSSNWVRVGKLKPEDLTKRANMLAEAANDFRELKELKARIAVVMAKRDSMATHWWNHVERTHCLPVNSNYTITDEGYIMMEPKGPKEAV